MAFEDVFPKPIKEAIESITKIPTYGERGASRFVYNLLKVPSEDRTLIVDTLQNLVKSIKNCSECGILTDRDVCAICSDSKRSKKFICVVEESQDAYAIEKLERYTGVYHILGGRIAPLEGISAQDLSIDKLLERIEKYKPKEVIIATNPNVEGEATANYIIKLLRKQFHHLKITRISYGLQFGSFIEFADEISLEKSLENRK
ncbi:recombination mediator RecR [Hydrogenobacter hydrogenophilus]|uniref:Recombination protein RecR n=1 Tax=Hydrogenobacter hydrogenophilus TaxID=35835 RepID=A0A285P0M2_9AQUI|nr:recombination mediator RecR [Hydrogenobacter hydrogenophilus]SNZ15280.1 DNA replication and repair protein RecR [Hydrogenobacter hydrogenophilus]